MLALQKYFFLKALSVDFVGKKKNPINQTDFSFRLCISPVILLTFYDCPELA